MDTDKQDIMLDEDAGPAAAAAVIARVKSPSYSPQLQDDSEIKPELTELSPSKAAVTSSQDFALLLSSASHLKVQETYDNLLSIYQYTLSRLQLLELIGTNGVLTDALLIRLQQLNVENERLLVSERAHRESLAGLKLQLDEQQRQSSETEAALHDAHQLLKQQEEELEQHTKLIQDLKDRQHIEQTAHKSRRSSDNRSNAQHSTSRRSSRDGSSSKEKERESRTAPLNEASRHRHRDTNGGAAGREQARHRSERESSVGSARYSSSRHGEGSSRRDRERDYSRGDPTQEDQEGVANSHTAMHDDEMIDGVAPQQVNVERRISINGAASKHAMAHNGSHQPLSASTITTKSIQPVDEEEDQYEPEIDLGEDLLLEEEEPEEQATGTKATSPPPPPTAPRSMRAARSPDRRDSDRHKRHDKEREHGRDRSSRSSQVERRRSRSPVRHREHRDDNDRSSSRRHDSSRQEKVTVEEEEGSSVRSPGRIKREAAAREERTHSAERPEKRERTSERRNGSSMLGRLGLPISGTANKEGGRTSMSIRGAGRAAQR